MKKIIIMTICLAFVSSLSFAGNSISMGSPLTSGATGNTGKTLYGDVTGSTADGNSPLIGKTSTGVGVGVLSNDNGYALVTQHTKGSKAFGTAYDSTSLYSKNVATEGTPLLAVPTATTTSDFSSWTSL